MRLSKVRLRERSDPENEDKAMASQVLAARDGIPDKQSSIVLEADMQARVVWVNGSRFIPFELVAFAEKMPPEKPAYEPAPAKPVQQQQQGRRR